MSAIIRDSFRVSTLTNFIAGLSSQSLYLAIGRPQYWDTVANLDTVVPVPVNTAFSLNSDWEDVMALKRLNVTDVISGIYKEVWQANTIYDIYRHDWNGTRVANYSGNNTISTTPASLSDVKCYVITSNYNIYVCLKQGISNGIIQPSIYSPDTGVAIGTNTGIIKTSDGYYWKFMAVTSSADFVKFSSKYYHPIETLTTAPAPSDPYYTQWINQGYSANFNGGIYTINVLSSGVGYNGGIAGTRVVTNAITDSQFSVIGNGSGLQYTISYGSNGSIVDIQVTNPGSGYTQATITAAYGNGGSFEIIFTPMSGLGCNPATDLVARYLLIDTTLTGAEGNIFTTSNEYRKILLLLNPTNYGTSTISTSADLDSTLTLNLGTGLSAGAYPLDSIVSGGTSGAKGRVVDFDTTTGNLRVIITASENTNNVGAKNSFQISETLTSSPGTGSNSIVSLTLPNVQKYSGNMIYSEYRSPVLRGPLQSEDIKISIKF
jgi:hypothetical protein